MDEMPGLNAIQAHAWRACSRCSTQLLLVRPLQKLSELVDAQPGVSDDTGHREGVDGFGSGNGENVFAISHDHVLALSSDGETSLLKCANSVLMIDAREFRHLDGDVDFTDLSVTDLVSHHLDILLYCFTDIRESFLLSSALRPASG